MVYIVVLFVILFVGFFAYTSYCNIKQEQEIERRKKIARYKNIINDMDELLLNASHIPYSKNLVLMLQNRILFALNNILECNPSLTSIRTRITDINNQIEYVNANYKSGEDNPFIPPKDDRQAISMLKIISKLRKVARSEHNRGKIDPKAFITEDRRLEILSIKINISSLMNHCRNAMTARQWGTAKQLINKAHSIIKTVTEKDPWLESRDKEFSDMDQTISKELTAMNQKEMKDIKEKEHDELDELFMPKKKW
jgi:hypothetical protein